MGSFLGFEENKVNAASEYISFASNKVKMCARVNHTVPCKPFKPSLVFVIKVLTYWHVVYNGFLFATDIPDCLITPKRGDNGSKKGL